MLSLIGMFLTQRTQKVTLEGIASNRCDVIPSVSSRYCYGTAAFPIIHRSPLGISSTIRLFANDCSLYRTITGPMDNQILQDYLNALSKWEKDWQMSFNIEKCHTVSFPTKMNIVTPYIILIVIHWIVATTIHIEASCSHRT